MIEEQLANYGVAGLMLVYFMADKAVFQKGLRKLVENNTIALTKVYEVISHCSKT